MHLTSLTPKELKAIELALPLMSATDKAELLAELEEREQRLSKKVAQTSLLGFAHHVYPGFKEGPHHRIIAQVFEDVLAGRKHRVIINIAPRMGKSEFTSYLFPTYFLGKYPDKKIIMATHTASLSEDFGRRVRNLIQADEYKELFPATAVADDAKAAGKWSTTQGGQYYAAGVGGALAGRGADLFVIDDPHSEQDVKNNSKSTFESAWSWFQTGPLQRLMPGGSIIVLMTRWGLSDLTGKLLDFSMKNPDSDQWELIELPAIVNENTQRERSLWPEQWTIENLKQKKASMSPQYWNAQYMQNPVADEGAIIKREWWKPWTKDKPPACEYIIGSLDAAAESHNRADFTSLTVWGVFDHPDEKGVLRSNIILLESIRERLEFPDLKQMALRMYKEWEMDDFIVEKKSSGTPLFQELRNIGVPVSEYTPHRGTGNKLARLNSVADIIKNGLVWYPEGTRWAMQVLDEVAAYPNGENDDTVDTTIMALMRFRNGGFIVLPSDYDDNESEWMPPRRAAYY